MMPEFNVMAVKLQVNPKLQVKPTKYTPAIPSPTVHRANIKKSSSVVRKPEDQQTRKSSHDFTIVEHNQSPAPAPEIIPPQMPKFEQKVYINMDERYLYYEQEAKKREYLIEISDGITFYKPIKPEDMVKPPTKGTKKKQTQVPTVVESHLTSDKKSVVSQHNQSNTFQESITQKSEQPNLDDVPVVEHKPVDPNFLVQGDVDGYKLDESQSQMFSYGLNDYMASDNHWQEQGDKDVSEEVKPKQEEHYSHADYHPKDGSVPKPLLESVNYRNWVQQQQQLLQNPQQ